jgi:RNA polymerase sigma-70 factor (ECF subfamily)
MQPSDDILVKRIKNGDMDAFELLVRRYESKVYTVAYRFLGSHADASDLAQETFLRLYQALPSFRGESSFLTWLYSVTANACRDEIRRKQRRPVVSWENEVLNNGSQAVSQALGRSRMPTPEEAAEQNEFNELIQQCLNDLPEEQRLILVMREIQGLSYGEIAGVLECSLGTVKSRLSRARRAFKDTYNSKREPFGQRSRLAR